MPNPYLERVSEGSESVDSQQTTGYLFRSFVLIVSQPVDAVEKVSFVDLVLLCYRKTDSCRIVLWAKRVRQAHRKHALRHISRAWQKSQGMPIVTFH
jgi:hypothetical protein